MIKVLKTEIIGVTFYLLINVINISPPVMDLIKLTMQLHFRYFDVRQYHTLPVFMLIYTVRDYLKG